MKKEREEILEKLKNIKTKAEYDLKNNHYGYENCIVKNVIHYNKKVELINKRTKEKEIFDLCVAVVEDPDTKQTTNMYYLDGEEIDFSELMMQYESPEPIKDVVDKTEENQKKPEKEQDTELEKEELNDMENEKDEETKEKSEDKQNKKIGNKAEHIIQTIDVDSTYIDNWTTVSRGFRLPPQVKEIAIAYPNKKDGNVLASNFTLYMLDDRGNIIQDINGKNAKDYFDIDDSTGSNPMYDDNTKLELEGYAEKNKGQTMRRFVSKQNPDLYLSAEQKKVGEYVEVYAGTRTRDGNDPVEVQLETDNVEIQTSLEMQEINSGYKGIYNKEDIDKEADEHENHEDDTDSISKENADGKKSTKTPCEGEIDIIDLYVSEIMKNETIETNYSEREVKEYLIEVIEKNPKMTPEQVKEYVETDLERNAPIQEKNL